MTVRAGVEQAVWMGDPGNNTTCPLCFNLYSKMKSYRKGKYDILVYLQCPLCSTHFMNKMSEKQFEYYLERQRNDS